MDGVFHLHGFEHYYGVGSFYGVANLYIQAYDHTGEWGLDLIASGGAAWGLGDDLCAGVGARCG